MPESISPPLRLALVGEPDREMADAVVHRRDVWRTMGHDALVWTCAGVCDLPRLEAELSAGRHVLCHRPVGFSAATWTALDAAATHGGAVCMLGGTGRFDPAVQQIRQSLDKGLLGKPGLLRMHRWEIGRETDGRLSADLDLASWLFGTLPECVYAQRRGSPEGSQTTQVHLGFAGGGMALLHAVAGLPGPAGYQSLELIGSSGAAYSDDHHNHHLLFGPHEPQALVADTRAATCRQELAAFVAAIHGDRSYPGPADGLRAAKLARAVEASLTSGQALTRRGDDYDV